MSRADFKNKEMWEKQRHTTISSKLDRIIELLERLNNPVEFRLIEQGEEE